MVILETSVFTWQIKELLGDDEYSLLQMELAGRPDTGKLIPGSGGLRKVRWSAKGKGKRGGMRIIYYWAESYSQILMLFIYSKGEIGDLTRSQIMQLSKIIKEEYP
jgi:mRNA-degrading endonuclease RelE of RelBE toxin-antitoxin system